MKRALLSLAAAGLLSACVAPDTVRVDGEEFPAAPTIVVAAPKGEVAAGGTIPTPSQAAKIFNAACVDTLPDFARAEAVLARSGMRQNPSTGAFVNTKLDLSVALVKAGSGVNCSIIFATSEDPKAAADRLASYGVNKGKRFFVAVIGQAADRTYLNAQIAAQ
jgi:hypothetical protein